MTLTGDFGKLRQAIRELYSVPVQRIPKMLAVDALELVDESFASQSDPYGSPWAPGKSVSGALLQKSGALRSRIRSRGSAMTLVVRSYGARYGFYNQHGATLRGRREAGRFSGPLKRGRSRKSLRSKGAERGKLPARPFLPGASIPAKWDARFRRTGEGVFASHFRVR